MTEFTPDELETMRWSLMRHANDARSELARIADPDGATDLRDNRDPVIRRRFRRLYGITVKNARVLRRVHQRSITLVDGAIGKIDALMAAQQ